MGNRLYIGNLSWQISEEELLALCAPFGPLLEARLVRDLETQRVRGFAFVMFANTADHYAALQGLEGYVHRGRTLRVSAAEDRPEPKFPRKDVSTPEVVPLRPGYTGRDTSGGQRMPARRAMRDTPKDEP